MRQVFYDDEEIARNGKKYYLRRKMYKRGGAGTLTVRTQAGGKGRALSSVKVRDFKSPALFYEAVCKLYHKWGKFERVVRVNALDYYVVKP